MSCDCQEVSVHTLEERRIVRQALVLNGLMCVIGLAAAYYAQSTGILADAIDMAADASGYGLALLAIQRGAHFRIMAARWTGSVLLVLGLGVILEAVRRWFSGAEPFGPVMMLYSAVSFGVNVYVLGALSKVREGGVHLNASYVCTRADVLANIGVFVSGGIVWLTGAGWVDLVAGVAIALLVFSEAREIFEGARTTEEAG